MKNVLNDNIDLFDFIRTFKQNIKILILIPIIAGLLSFGATFLIKEKFVSEFILMSSDPALDSFILRSSNVIDKTVHSLNNGQIVEIENQRRNLIDKLKLKYESKFVIVQVEASSPLLAQKTAQNLVENWFLEKLPSEKNRKKIEKEISSLKSSLSVIENKINSLNNKKQIVDGDLKNGINTQAIIELMKFKEILYENILKKEELLEGVTRDDLFLAPTLPSSLNNNINKFKIVAASFLSTFFLLLFWVFLKKNDLKTT